jgi:hypothetical protein
MTDEEARAAGYAPAHEVDPGVMTPEEAKAAGYAPAEDKPQAEGPIGSVVRHVADEALPFAASLPAMGPGFAAGAAAGAPLAPFTGGLSIPVGGFIGAGVAGAGAGWIAGKAQDLIKRALGLDDTAQNQANDAANPNAALVAQGIESVAAFKSGKLAGSLASRLLTGGGMAGFDVGQQELTKGSDQPIDWKQAAVSGVLGAVFNEPRSGTARLMPGHAGPNTPGRPDQDAPNKEADAAAVDQDDVTTTAPGIAADNPPVNAEYPPDTVGNEQSAPQRSEREYPKGIDMSGGEPNGAITPIENGVAPAEKLALSGESLPLDTGIAPKENKGITLDPDAYHEPKSEADYGDAAIGEDDTLPANAQPDAYEAGPHDEAAGHDISDEELPGHLAERGLDHDRLQAMADARQPQMVQRANGTMALDMGGERTGTGPQPKVVTEAISHMREIGANEVADALEKAPPAKQAVLAAQYLAAKTGRTGQSERTTVRVPSKAPVVDGLNVTGRSKADIARKQGAYTAVKSAFEKFPPPASNLPPGPPSSEYVAALRDRLQGALDHAKEANGGKDPLGKLKDGGYQPAKKDAAYAWLKAAKKLVGGRMTTNDIAKFTADELQLRSGKAEDVENVNQTRRIKADSELRRAPTVEQAEATRAQDFPGETPHEDAEATTTPEPITDASQIKEPTGKTLDLTKPDTYVDPASITGNFKNIEAERLRLQAEKTARLKALKEAAQAEKSESPAKKFASDESGALDLQKVKDAAKRANDKINEIRTPSKEEIAEMEKPGSFRAKNAASPAEEYSRSIDDDLFKNTKKNEQNKVDNGKVADEARADPNYTDADRKQAYKAQEGGALQHLPAKLKAAYDKYTQPILDKNTVIRDAIKKLAGKNFVGPDVVNHVRRVLDNGASELDPNASANQTADPTQNRDLATRRRGTLKDRAFYALERVKDGQRTIMSPNSKGFTQWQNRVGKQVTDPGFEYKDGKQVKIGNDTYKMTEALTDEIEKHAMLNGKPVKYLQDAHLSAVAANQELTEVYNSLKYVDDLKAKANTPGTVENKYMTTDKKRAEDEGFEKTEMDTFNRPGSQWYMAPELKEVFDDYNKPGLSENGWDSARKLSQNVTKTLFWLPVKHILNVGAHWTIHRGAGWVTPEGWKQLAKTAPVAIRDVINQGPIQKEMREVGAANIYGGVATQDFVNNIARKLGHEIQSNAGQYKFIADHLGVGLGEIAAKIYDVSKHTMWAVNDMLNTQAYLEAKARGFTPKAAANYIAKDIPTYRMPTRLAGSRMLSKVYSDPLGFSFSRYHNGVINAMANTIKDARSGTKSQRVDAAARMILLGAIAYFVYPQLDKAAKYITGNNFASIARSGPWAVTSTLADTREGRADPTQAFRNIASVSPLLSAAKELYDNRDFAGRTIMSPGDVSAAMHGSVTAAGRVGVQAGEHAVRGLVSPFNTGENAGAKGLGLASGIRDEALAIKNPSPASSKFQIEAQKKANQEAINRFKKPRGSLERAYDYYTSPL